MPKLLQEIWARIIESCAGVFAYLLSAISMATVDDKWIQNKGAIDNFNSFAVKDLLPELWVNRPILEMRSKDLSW